MPHFRLTARLQWGLHFGAVVTAGIVLSACSNGTDGDQPDFTGHAGMPTVESTTDATAEGTSTTKSPGTHEKEPPVVTVTETERQPAQPPQTTSGGRDFIAGLGEHGWTSVHTYADCHGSERVVFAGTGPDGRAIVCQDQAGTLIYRSTIFGGEFTGSIIGQDGANYYVDASPSIIVVTPSGVSVREGGGLAATADFSDSWQR
ncbi:hypothetical protein [Corynebacterium macginleyi]|uniref:hypothetical protein n=1 Tax=Corynebacterium macginleyi TaxID=38290 RepID=UPI0019092FDF|nr:hypothetical protein [Corynebacterium macginleyi]